MSPSPQKCLLSSRIAPWWRGGGVGYCHQPGSPGHQYFIFLPSWRRKCISKWHPCFHLLWMDYIDPQRFNDDALLRSFFTHFLGLSKLHKEQLSCSSWKIHLSVKDTTNNRAYCFVGPQMTMHGRFHSVIHTHVFSWGKRASGKAVLLELTSLLIKPGSHDTCPQIVNFAWATRMSTRMHNMPIWHF